MRVIVIGRGKMGALLSESAAAHGHEVIAMADAANQDEVKPLDCDAVIDFSHPDNLEWVCAYVRARHCVLICGTTGLNDAQKQLLQQTAQACPVFYSANFSYGIAMLEKMLEKDYRIGGEQSGHIIFSKYATTGDGILTSLLLMEVMLEKKQTLAKLTEEVKIYPQLLKNVRVSDKKTARENAEVIKAVEAVTEALGNDGRILVRESGTEPVIRVMVEASTDELCEKYVNQVVEVMHQQGLIVG